MRNVRGNVSHNDTLAAVTIAAGAYLYGVDPNHALDEATWMIAILAGAPICLLGQWLDIRLDHMNLALAAADRAAAEGRTYIISFMVFRALTQFLVNAIVTMLASATSFYWYCKSALSPVVTDAMAVIATYVVPAVGLAVALSLLRHRSDHPGHRDLRGGITRVDSMSRTTPSPAIGTLTLLRVLWRSFFIRPPTITNGQSVGFVFCMTPALTRLYEGDQLKDALARH